MDYLRDRYKETTLLILGSFQLLEFALKSYIGNTYSLIAKRVEGIVHFSYSAKDVESFPLERLINTFSKINSNKELIKRLNKLRTERNHIAHNSLIITMGNLYDPGAVEDKTLEYFWLEDELTECLQLVIAEARALRERSTSGA